MIIPVCTFINDRLLSWPALFTKRYLPRVNLIVFRPIYRFTTLQIFLASLRSNMRYVTCERGFDGVYVLKGLFYVGFGSLPMLREFDNKFADILQKNGMIELRRHFGIPFEAEVVLN